MKNVFLLLAIATYSSFFFACQEEIFLPRDSSFFDNDLDGIIDDEDNCPEIANADQLDTDGDGIGDDCDDDIDGDNIMNSIDNCPNIANDQTDSDDDGIGDACDPIFDGPQDSDGDGIPDRQDNCVYFANPDQVDENSNGIGDQCENGFVHDGTFYPTTLLIKENRDIGSVDLWFAGDASFDESNEELIGDELDAIFIEFYFATGNDIPTNDYRFSGINDSETFDAGGVINLSSNTNTSDFAFSPSGGTVDYLNVDGLISVEYEMETGIGIISGNYTGTVDFLIE